MIKRHFDEIYPDWWNPNWLDQAYAAVYEGIWRQSETYGEVETKLLQCGYFPEEAPFVLFPFHMKYGEVSMHEEFDTHYPVEYPEAPYIVEFEKRRVKRKEKERAAAQAPKATKPPATTKQRKRVDKRLAKDKKLIKELQSSLVSEIQIARDRIQNFLKSSDIYDIDVQFDTPGFVPSLVQVNKAIEDAETPECFRERVEKLEKEYDVVLKRLNALTKEVREKLMSMNEKAIQTEKQKTAQKDPRAEPSEFKKVSDEINANLKAKYYDCWPRHTMTLEAAARIDDFDDYDELAAFGSDEESNAVAEKELKEEAEAEFDKRAKKVPKTQYIFDVLTLKTKTNRDMMELTKAVRGIKKDGLRIRATKILSVQYGVRRLQVVCVVEDEKLTIAQVKDILRERKDLVTRVEVVHIKKL